jgi:hypothetical protein
VISASDIVWELGQEEPTSGDDALTTAICEAQSYRILAQQLLHALHDVQVERDLLKKQGLIDRRRQEAA